MSEVSTAQIQSYLVANGWIKDATLVDVATIWHRRDSEDAEIVLPESEGLKDFRQRLNDVFSVLASVEERTVDEIVADIRDVKE